MPTIMPVVEGHGEVPSMRPLIFQVLAHLGSETPISVETPIRIPKSKLIRNQELERAVRLASLRCGEDGLILVLVDADDDCAARLGKELEERGREVTAARVRVVLPVREYEAWLLASARSLAGLRGFPDDLEPPDDPEAIGDAKGWLTEQLPSGEVYKETVDQPRLTSSLSVDDALRARSFLKFYSEIANFVGAES